MQRIDFHFHVTDRTRYVARLIKKVRGMGLSVAVWGRSEPLMRRAYNDLYTFEDLTFIAHAWADSPYAAKARVIFALSLEALAASDVLITLDEEVPPDWQHAYERFDRVVDIVPVTEPELTHARQRYRIYKGAGVQLQVFDRSKA